MKNILEITGVGVGTLGGNIKELLSALVHFEPTVIGEGKSLMVREDSEYHYSQYSKSTLQPGVKPKGSGGMAYDSMPEEVKKAIADNRKRQLRRSVPVTSHFIMIFWCVVGLTVLSGGGQALIASYWTQPTAMQSDVFASLGFAWKFGIGAIFGLLGSKVT